MERTITKKMLDTIREGIESNRHYTAKPIEDEEIKPKNNFLSEAIELMHNVTKKKINEESERSGKEFEIKANTPQFGDVYTNQVAQLKKTLEEDMEIKITYYPDLEDLALNGKIKSLNIIFQFRYRDSSGEGCYIWANELQLSDGNTRKLGKIRDAFLNWKSGLIQDSDLMEKLKKVTNKKQK